MICKSNTRFELVTFLDKLEIKNRKKIRVPVDNNLLDKENL